jgi:hypothetical protein
VATSHSNRLRRNPVKKFVSLAAICGATLVLAACGNSEDASTEAEADTVELPADDALESVTEEPEDAAAANEASAQPEEDDELAGPPPAPVTRETAESAAEKAADVAEQAEEAEKAAEAAEAAAAAIDE